MIERDFKKIKYWTTKNVTNNNWEIQLARSTFIEQINQCLGLSTSIWRRIFLSTLDSIMFEYFFYILYAGQRGTSNTGSWYIVQQLLWLFLSPKTSLLPLSPRRRSPESKYYYDESHCYYCYGCYANSPRAALNFWHLGWYTNWFAGVKQSESHFSACSDVCFVWRLFMEYSQDGLVL